MCVLAGLPDPAAEEMPPRVRVMMRQRDGAGAPADQREWARFSESDSALESSVSVQ